MRDALDHARLEQRGKGLHVNLGRSEQHVAKLLTAQFVQYGVHGVAGLLEQGLAHQGETVGMHAGGRQADKHVALSDGGAVDDSGLFGHADREASQIVLVLVIHARHLGGLAADQTGTGLATQSMPMVSCLLAILATTSLVPTPSVPEISTGSL